MKITMHSKKKTIWTAIIATTVIIGTVIAASTASILSSSNQIANPSHLNSLAQNFSKKNLSSYGSLKFPVLNPEIAIKIKAALTKQQISYDDSFKVVNVLNASDNSVSYYEFSVKSKKQDTLYYGIYYIKNTGDKAEGLIKFTSNENPNISYTVSRILQIGLDMNNHLYILVSSRLSLPFGYVYFQKYKTKADSIQNTDISEMSKISNSIYNEMDLGGSSINDWTNNFILSRITPEQNYVLTKAVNQKDEYQSQHIISNGDGTYTDDSNEVHDATVSADSSNDIGTVSTIDYTYDNSKTTTLTATNVTTATTYNNKPQIFRLNPASNNKYTSLTITDLGGKSINLDTITAMYSSNQNKEAPIYLATKSKRQATIYIADNYDGSNTIKFKKITLANTINDEINRFLETKDNNIYAYGIYGEIYNIQTGKEILDNITAINSFNNKYYITTSDKGIYTYQNSNWQNIIVGKDKKFDKPITHTTSISKPNKTWITTQDAVYVSSDGISFQKLPVSFSNPVLAAQSIGTDVSPNYSYIIVDDNHVFNSEDVRDTLNIKQNGQPLDNDDILVDKNSPNTGIIDYKDQQITIQLNSKVYDLDKSTLNGNPISTADAVALDPAINSGTYEQGNNKLTLVLKTGETITYNLWEKSGPNKFNDNYNLTVSSGYKLFGEDNNALVNINGTYYPLLAITQKPGNNDDNLITGKISDKNLTSSVQLGTLAQNQNDTSYTFKADDQSQPNTLEATKFELGKTYQITLTDQFQRTATKYLEVGVTAQTTSYSFKNGQTAADINKVIEDTKAFGITFSSNEPMMESNQYNQLTDFNTNIKSELFETFKNNTKGFIPTKNDFEKYFTKYAPVRINFASQTSVDTVVINANLSNLKQAAASYVNDKIKEGINTNHEKAKTLNIKIAAGSITDSSSLTNYKSFVTNYEKATNKFIDNLVTQKYKTYTDTTLGWTIPDFSESQATTYFGRLIPNLLNTETWNNETNPNYQKLVTQHFNQKTFETDWLTFLETKFKNASFNPKHQTWNDYLASQIKNAEKTANLHGRKLVDVLKKAKITAINKPKNEVELMTNYDNKGMSYKAYLEKVSQEMPVPHNNSNQNKLIYEVIIPVVAGGVIGLALIGLFIGLFVIRAKRNSRIQFSKAGRAAQSTSYQQNNQRSRNYKSKTKR